MLLNKGSLMMLLGEGAWSTDSTQGFLFLQAAPVLFTKNRPTSLNSQSFILSFRKKKKMKGTSYSIEWLRFSFVFIPLHLEFNWMVAKAFCSQSLWCTLTWAITTKYCPCFPWDGHLASRKGQTICTWGERNSSSKKKSIHDTTDRLLRTRRFFILDKIRQGCFSNFIE